MRCGGCATGAWRSTWTATWDGELVTQLRFAGTNETPATLGGGPLPIRATGLPFRFNVTVRAPFRALLGTASSFNDVRPLIRPAANGVQPQ